MFQVTAIPNQYFYEIFKALQQYNSSHKKIQMKMKWLEALLESKFVIVA